MLKLTVTMVTDNETDADNVEYAVVGAWPTFDGGEWTGDEWVMYSNPNASPNAVQAEIEYIKSMPGCTVEVETVENYE